jgi:hypothetical protein
MKNKITETDWENVIDAEVDINISLSIGIVLQSIAGIESVIKIGSNRDVLPDRASKCVGLFIILISPVDINSACSNFTKTFLNIAKTCIPTREVTIRSDDKVWFDSDLRRESRKRDRLRQIFFRTLY